MGTTTSSTSRAPRMSKTNIFGLPQELQDEILRLAYPRVDKLKLVSRRELEDKRERRQHRAGKRTFPPPIALKVDEWLVSRRFFLAAAKAWIGAQHLQCDYTALKIAEPLSRAWREGIPIACRTLPLYAFATNVSCTMYILPTSSYDLSEEFRFADRISPHLKVLTVYVGDQILRVKDTGTHRTKFGAEVEFSDFDLEIVRQRTGLARLSGLPEVHIRGGWHRECKTTNEKEVCHRNIARSKHVTRLTACKPRAGREATPTSSLYHG